MKILKYALLITLAIFSASCSEKAPGYPDAGLVIEDGSATCRFYTKQELNGHMTVTLTTSQIEYSEKGHKLLVEWNPDYGKNEDLYEFMITADGVTSRKVVSYNGTPMTLMEKPFKVSLEDVKQ